jgi:flagellar motor switch protein FliN
MAPHTEPHEHEFQEIDATKQPPRAPHLDIKDLGKVRLGVSAELGRCLMTVREVLELDRGSVVTLYKNAGEMTDIYVNNLPLARGEVVVIGDGLNVRIAEIIGAADLGEEHSGEE